MPSSRSRTGTRGDLKSRRRVTLEPHNITIENHSDWYHRTAREIDAHKITLGSKDAKKYQLELLLRLAARIDSFALICGECQSFKVEINRLTASLGGIVQLSKEERKSYSGSIKNITRHLQKEHKLVTEGQYAGIGMAIGIAIGAGIGAATDNTGPGTPIGMAFGYAIGYFLEKKARKEGQMI